MADLILGSTTAMTESGGTVTLDNGVQDQITRLGTVTSGQSQFREESDVVLLGTNTWSVAANGWNLDNVISSTYQTYLITGQYKLGDGTGYIQLRFRDSSSADIDGSNYTYIHNAFIDSGGGSRGNSAAGQTQMRLDNDSGNEMWNNVQLKIFIGRSGQSTDQVSWEGTNFQWRDSLNVYWVNTYGGYMTTAIDPRGFKIFASGGNINTHSFFSVYGLK